MEKNPLIEMFEKIDQKENQACDVVILIEDYIWMFSLPPPTPNCRRGLILGNIVGVHAFFYKEPA